MTRIEKANFRTKCNERLRSTIALTEEWLQMSLAPRFHNGDVAQTVERSLRMQNARGTGIDAPHLQFFRGARKSKKEIGETVLLDQKKTWIFYVQYGKEASEIVQNLLRKRLVSRITKVYLRKTSEETLLYWWVNQRHPSDMNSLFGPTSEACESKAKRLACEKHMDWWPASTKPIL